MQAVPQVLLHSTLSDNYYILAAPCNSSMVQIQCHVVHLFSRSAHQTAIRLNNNVVILRREVTTIDVSSYTLLTFAPYMRTPVQPLSEEKNLHFSSFSFFITPFLLPLLHAQTHTHTFLLHFTLFFFEFPSHSEFQSIRFYMNPPG